MEGMGQCDVILCILPGLPYRHGLAEFSPAPQLVFHHILPSWTCGIHKPWVGMDPTAPEFISCLSASVGFLFE